MPGEKEPEKSTRHVLDEGPDQVAMPVTEHEAAAGMRGARPDVPDDRVWEVKTGMTRELQAEIEVEVFHVRKEILIETADGLEGRAWVDAGGGAGGKDRTLVGVSTIEWFGVVTPPGEAAGVIDVPLAIKNGLVCGFDQTGSEEVAGMVKAGTMNIFKPIRFGKSVRVQENDTITFGVFGGEVVAAGETEVGIRL